MYAMATTYMFAREHPYTLAREFPFTSVRVIPYGRVSRSRCIQICGALLGYVLWAIRPEVTSKG